jgi:putative peptidoglycan lipid II flippase
VRWIVAGYTVGLIGFSSVRLLASAFHAFQDYRTPLRASIAAITTSAVLALALALPFRESIYATVGLGIASAIGSYVNLSILLGGLHKRLGVLFTPAMWASTARVALAAAVATLGAYPIRQLLAERHYLITAAGTLSAFGGIFLIIAYATGSQEAARWLRKLRVVRRSP